MRRRRLLVSLAPVVGMLTVGAGAVQAEPEPVVCAVVGTLTFAPGLGVVPVAQAVGGTLTLTCPVLGDDAGVWTLVFAGVGLDSCEAGAGSAVWIAPSAGPFPEGAVAGPGISYTHVGPFAIDLAGTVPSAGPPAEVHEFTAHLAWTTAPAGLACVAPPVGAVGVGGVALMAE
ncbi:MAG: hypothetical protein QOI20_2128 [Acidimicrobiaceae bacterium]|jgi:hypothetical protein|nr:hypothetical protein [Acidimicrobiaceae bacterium]